MRVIVAFSIYLTLIAFTVKGAGLSLTKISLKQKFTVVLDAGHGGKDPGKPSKEGYRESDIALKIVLALGRELEKYDDIEVIYTRKKDVFIDLKERGSIANKAEADLFISVHCNAHTSQAYGAETYVLGIHRNETNFNVAKAENAVIFLEDDYEETYSQYNLDSPESVIGLELEQEEFLDQSVFFASLIQDNFREKLKRKDRSVKQAGFIVLHQTVMPSVLVETGFITNKKEGAFLNSSRGQEKIATAISGAVLEYKRNIQTNEEVYTPGWPGSGTQEKGTSIVKDKLFPEVTFKVQIAASKRKLAPKSYNFKGLKDISRVKEGGLYKYYCGATSNYTAIQEQLKQAKAKGYTSAYIVSYNKSNIKIPLTQVLN